jgi:hypothetical protein
VGALYADLPRLHRPADAFSPVMELTTIAIVLLGGMGTVLGPLVGAVVLSVVNELLWARFPRLPRARRRADPAGGAVHAARHRQPRDEEGLAAAGRGLLRQLAREDERVPQAPAILLADE